MGYPFIRHIDDVLPSVAGREEFIVAERPGYTVIDYRYVIPDSFDDPMRRECRGIKFGKNGRLLARPLHKFFNHGERPETSASNVDFSLPHTVVEKMDGSMIHPAWVDGRVRLMTRMGLSDVALKAEELFLDEPFAMHVALYTVANLTPIFEYVGPENRIVEAYEKPELVLLQVRDNLTGAYESDDRLVDIARFFGVRPAPSYPAFSNHADVLAIHRRKEGEGVVVKFSNGLFLKIKTDEYRRLHRIRDDVSREHDLVRLIIDGTIDDAFPLFDGNTRAKVWDFAVTVSIGIAENAKLVDHLVSTGAELDQKTFAVEHLAEQSSSIRSACFKARSSGESGHKVLTDLIRAKSRDAKGFESVRDLCGGARLDIKVYMGDAG